jgi:hypothetical protein
MQEYKREKAGLESRLNQMTKAAAHHDNHLRAIDAWFRQLIDEVKTILGPSQESIKGQLLSISETKTVGGGDKTDKSYRAHVQELPPV